MAETEYKSSKTNTKHHHHHHEMLNFAEIFKIRKSVKLHHQILYVAMVFIGLNLCWFGVWTGIADTPYLNNPLIAVIVGVILMLFTGRVKKLG